MDTYSLPFNLRDGLLCLSFLIGAIGGVIAIARRQKTSGILMLAGFLFLGIDPILEVLLFRVLITQYSGTNYEIFNWAYFCLGTPATLIGVGCLIAALFVAIRPKPAVEENEPVQIPDPDATQIG